MEKNNDNPLAKRGPGRPKTVVENEPEVKDTDTVTLTGSELKALKALISGAAQPVSSDPGVVNALVEALRESRKPYKSDAEKENDKKQRDQMRETIKRTMLNEERNRLYCRHRAGTNGLSDVPHPHNAFSSIIWHDITNQLRWGVCTVCQRQFWPSDSDYRYWRSQRSYNRNSATGERDGVDIQTWMEAEHPLPFGTTAGKDPREVIRERELPIF